MAAAIAWPLVPMLAKLTRSLPEDDERWAFEIKWDGIRILARVEGGVLQLMTRNLIDATARFPALQALGGALDKRSVVLDGEVVAFDAAGRATFEAVQQRATACYMIFDILEIDGRSLLSEPYTERRHVLEDLALEGSCWRTPPFTAGGGDALLAASREQRHEGIVAKRLDSPYEPGGRGGAWIKLKNQRRQEFVIGGWVPGSGKRDGKIGALVVGYFEDGALVSAGKVGTGFTNALLAELAERLAPLARASSPFARGAVPQETRFVEPRLVGEVEFIEWTSRGSQLRHPSFKGLRFDKPAHEVVREDEQ